MPTLWRRLVNATLSAKLIVMKNAVFVAQKSDGSEVTITTDELAVLDGITSTAAEINAAADVSARLVDIGDNTTYTVLAANSGKPHVLPDLTADITITMPAVASGLEYTFLYYGIAADAHDWIIDTGADANFYLGGLAHLDTDAGSGGDEVVPVPPDGNSNSKLSVLVPDVGTRVTLLCDGTSWILSGYVVGATAPTYADQ